MENVQHVQMQIVWYVQPGTTARVVRSVIMFHPLILALLRFAANALKIVLTAIRTLLAGNVNLDLSGLPTWKDVWNVCWVVLSVTPTTSQNATTVVSATTWKVRIAVLHVQLVARIVRQPQSVSNVTAGTV